MGPHVVRGIRASRSYPGNKRRLGPEPVERLLHVVPRGGHCLERWCVGIERQDHEDALRDGRREDAALPLRERGRDVGDGRETSVGPRTDDADDVRGAEVA